MYVLVASASVVLALALARSPVLQRLTLPVCHRTGCAAELFGRSRNARSVCAEANDHRRGQRPYDMRTALHRTHRIAAPPPIADPALLPRALSLCSAKDAKVDESGGEDVFTFELQLKSVDRRALQQPPASSVPPTPSAAGAAGAAAKQHTSVTSVAFIKTVSAVDKDAALTSQLHCCSLNPTAPFDSILNYVRHCFLPFSRALMASVVEATATSTDEKKEAADALAIRGVNSKLSELEGELVRSQQTIDIPLITLEVHKTIADFLKKVNSRRATLLSPSPPARSLTRFLHVCLALSIRFLHLQARTESKTAKVEDLGPVATESFLNEVQRGLGEWKKQITSVTRLDR
jgi:hypothetical protein